jgi:hypothetical protein
MSIATLILGESGTGKTASLRNLPAAQTLLIQAVRKPLPFRAAGWSAFDKTSNPTGNVFRSDQSESICALMSKTRRKIVVIDDWQYVLANEYMRRSDERGYEKFTDIGRHAWDILMQASALSEDVRVYILAHTQTDDFGRVRIKTIGKMLDEKITPEGLVTICLRTSVVDGAYRFSTRNNGSDTVKAPMGLFDADHIDNDLAAVDAAICAYYEISTPAAQAA